MPILRVENVAQYGLNLDLAPFQLAPNTWTAGENVRFLDNKMSKFKGHSTFATPPTGWDKGLTQVYWLLPVETAGTFYWIYAGLDSVYVYDGSTHTDITRQLSSKTITAISIADPTEVTFTTAEAAFVNDDQVTISGSDSTPLVDDTYLVTKVDTTHLTLQTLAGVDVPVTGAGTAGTIIFNDKYTSTDVLGWTGGIIGGIPILNNGADEPQSWLSVAGRLTDLANWTLGDYCGAMRVYKNYLIAMDVTQGGTRNQSLVKWSDSAALGAVPASWDVSDNTTDAGERSLEDSVGDTNSGSVIDGLQLRDAFIVYKDNATWSMNFIGGSQIFQFRKIFGTKGLMARNCVQEYDGNHFVVGNSDVYIHNGVTAQSAIDNKTREFFYTDLDGDNYAKTFVYHNIAEHEMWICYPVSGTFGLPTKALIWNYRHDTWSKRDLPGNGTFGTGHIENGIVDNSGVAADLWSTNDGNWDTWNVSWGNQAFSPQESNPLIAADKLYKGDDTEQFDGSNMEVSVERTDIPIGEQDQIVRIKRVTPRIEGSAAVNVTVGAHLVPGSAADYQASVAFTPGTDRKVDVRKTGTHAAIKFDSSGDQTWDVTGYDIEYEVVHGR